MKKILFSLILAILGGVSMGQADQADKKSSTRAMNDTVRSISLKEDRADVTFQDHAAYYHVTDFKRRAALMKILQASKDTQKKIKIEVKSGTLEIENASALKP